MQDKLDQDLKAAMLAGDKAKAEVIKGLKNALQYEQVAQGADKPLTDEQVQKTLTKEAKKRSEAIELYEKAGEKDRAETEKAEKAIIDGYLPEQVDEAKVAEVVKAEVAKLDSPSMADMGKIIGAVRGQLGAGADGGTIAKLVKQELEK